MSLVYVANGAAREFFMKGPLGDHLAHQLSTVSLLVLFTLHIWLVSRLLPFTSAGEALLTGALWLVLTLAFEFGLGLAAGKTWSFMLQDYNLLAGRIWVLIPVWVAAAPFVFYRLCETAP